MAYDPRKLAENSWLVTLKAIPRGDYGFMLSNETTGLRSTTGFASQVYTFHVY